MGCPPAPVVYGENVQNLRRVKKPKMRISHRFDILSPDKKVDDGGLGGRLLAVWDAGGGHRHDHEDEDERKCQ